MLWNTTINIGAQRYNGWEDVSSVEDAVGQKRNGWPKLSPHIYRSARVPEA